LRNHIVSSVHPSNVAFFGLYLDHLVGTKKVQQILAKPGVLEKFLPHVKDHARIRRCFTDLYPLDESSDGQYALKLGLETPESFVMKPQREGGGIFFWKFET
jgi:glutathione synthase